MSDKDGENGRKLGQKGDKGQKEKEEVIDVRYKGNVLQENKKIILEDIQALISNQEGDNIDKSVEKIGINRRTKSIRYIIK